MHQRWLTHTSVHSYPCPSRAVSSCAIPTLPRFNNRTRHLEGLPSAGFEQYVQLQVTLRCTLRPRFSSRGYRKKNLQKAASTRPSFTRVGRPCASANGARPLEVPANAEADKKVARLRNWLHQLAHDECNLLLERWPRGTSAPGYGTVAGPGGVEKGSVVVRVPKQAFMTEETAAGCPYVGPLAERANLTPWQAMCLHLLCERARGSDSHWYPYISLLPSELEMAGAHPMLWPQRMRKEWLAGSPMLETTERRLSICREDHEAMLVAGASNLVPAGSGSGGFVTEAAVRWAAVMLLSRAFSLELQEEVTCASMNTAPAIALVPWADMLNHSSYAGKESCLVYDQSARVACLRAHRPYEEGEQVYDSYGPGLSASQLLLDYGFVDRENSNYAVDLPASVLGPIKSKMNEALLEAVGLPIGW